MFKTDDQVKVVKIVPMMDDDLEELQAYVGRVGVIHNVCRWACTFGVRFSNGDRQYFVEEELCLKQVIR